jgi:uncharacterized membrane protein YgdD (TMEM256/DUF423 family)
MRKFSIAGVSFALFAVILGAFASHALKDHFEVGVLQSFEAGIRYMMYHGLALLILSQMSVAQNPWIFRLFFWGVIFFSFSIFDLSWVGPITPIGGSLLIIGWAMLLWKIIKNKAE